MAAPADAPAVPARPGGVLAAYGGIFVAGSLAWGIVVDKVRPDRYDLIGTAICLAGVAVIMYAPAANPNPRGRNLS